MTQKKTRRYKKLFSFDKSKCFNCRIHRRQKLHPQKQRSKYICKPEAVIEAGNHFVWEFCPGRGSLNVPSNSAILHRKQQSSSSCNFHLTNFQFSQTTEFVSLVGMIASKRRLSRTAQLTNTVLDSPSVSAQFTSISKILVNSQKFRLCQHVRQRPARKS